MAYNTTLSRHVNIHAPLLKKTITLLKLQEIDGEKFMQDISLQLLISERTID